MPARPQQPRSGSASRFSQPNRLRTLREADGLSPVTLAERISSHYGGERGAASEHVSERTVRRWESGETPIPQRYWSEIADLFRVSVPHLLCMDSEGGCVGGQTVRSGAA